VVVLLAITSDGTKIPVGVWEGDTEKKAVVTRLLADLAERGPGCEMGRLSSRWVQAARRRGQAGVRRPDP